MHADKPFTTPASAATSRNQPFLDRIDVPLQSPKLHTHGPDFLLRRPRTSS